MLNVEIASGSERGAEPDIAGEDHSQAKAYHIHISGDWVVRALWWYVSIIPSV
jgi:hypothetical protein